jgi:hypothetical protein
MEAVNTTCVNFSFSRTANHVTAMSTHLSCVDQVFLSFAFRFRFQLVSRIDVPTAFHAILQSLLDRSDALSRLRIAFRLSIGPVLTSLVHKLERCLFDFHLLAASLGSAFFRTIYKSQLSRSAPSLCSWHTICGRTNSLGDGSVGRNTFNFQCPMLRGHCRWEPRPLWQSSSSRLRQYPTMSNPRHSHDF